MGFYTVGTSGTVKGPSDDDFDAEAAGKKLYEGMKGLGTDENAVIDVLANHTNEQRQEIKNKFKTMYGKELTEEMESELGGSFAKVVMALLQDPEEFLIDSLHRSIEGLGTDEYSLIGLLCPRTNDELSEMKTRYKEKYEKEMEEDVADDLSGDLRTLMIGLMTGGRDESEDVDADKVQEDAKELFEAGQGQLGTKEEAFAVIFNQRSGAHMRQVFDAYKELSDGKELEEAIESEFSGSLQNAYLALIKIFRSPAEFHAERIREAIKGAGTDDDALIQLVVSRSEIDLKDICDAYETKYESKLMDDVASDTSGDYGLILQRILDCPAEEEAAEEGEAEPAAEEDGAADADDEAGEETGADAPADE